LRFSFGKVKKITNFVIKSTLKYGAGFEKDPDRDGRAGTADSMLSAHPEVGRGCRLGVPDAKRPAAAGLRGNILGQNGCPGYMPGVSGVWSSW
jgi:hypothetical protein